MRWINYQIIKRRRKRYHQWWQLIALWVTALSIKAPVLTRSVLWRSGWLLTKRGQLRWIDDWIIQQRRPRYHIWWQLVAILLTFLAIKSPVITRRRFCLTWLFPAPLLCWLPILFGRYMMDAILVYGGVVYLLFCLLMAKKRWDPNFWRNNCSHVWVSVRGIKLITSFLSQYNPNWDQKCDLSEKCHYLRYIYLTLKQKIIIIKFFNMSTTFWCSYWYI